MSAHRSLKNNQSVETKKKSHPGQAKASARKKSRRTSLNSIHSDPKENARIMGEKAREANNYKTFNSDRLKNMKDNRNRS